MNNKIILNEELVEEINEELMYEYNVTIPFCFLNNNSDIKAFADLEQLFQKNFSFQNKKISSLSYYFKFEISDLNNFEKKFDNARKKEIQSWGFGYAKKAQKGKASSKEGYNRLISYYEEEIDINIYKNLFKNAKTFEFSILYNIGPDYVTDFILIMKEEEIKDFSYKIYGKILGKFNILVNDFLIFLVKKYLSNNNIEIEDLKDHIFPYLIPLEIIDVNVGSISLNFKYSIAEQFCDYLFEKRILFSKPKYSEIKKAAKYNFSDYSKSIVQKWWKFYEKESKFKIENLQKIKKTKQFNSIENLKNLNSWELDFFLSDSEILKSLNLKRSVLLINSNNNVEPIKYYEINNKIIIFKSKTNLNSDKLISFAKKFRMWKPNIKKEIEVVITNIRSEINENFIGVLKKHEINVVNLNDKELFSKFSVDNSINFKDHLFEKVIVTEKENKKIFIKYLNLSSKIEKTIEIVSEDYDFSNNDFKDKITINSPLGKALINSGKDNFINMKINGKIYHLKILEIINY